MGFKPLKDVSIRTKMLLIIMITSASALILASGAFLAYEFSVSREADARTLRTLTDVLSAQSTAAVAFNEPATAGGILNSLASNPEVLCAVIFLEDGRRFAEYRRDSTEASAPPAASVALGDRVEGSHLVSVTPVRQEGRDIGRLYIRTDLSASQERLRTGVGITALVLVLSSLAALLLSLKLAKVVTAPIQDLAGTVKTVSQDRDFSIQAPARGSDEVGQLIDGFNEMLVRIRLRDDALHQAQAELEKRVEERTKSLQDEIAERKRAVEARDQADARLGIAMEAAHLGGWDWDVVSDTGTSTGQGPLTGQLKGKPLNRNAVLSKIHPDDHERVKRYFEEIFKAGGDYSLEYRVLQPDGEVRWAFVSGRASRDADGKPATLSSIEMDITDRKRREEEIHRLNDDLQRHARQLEAAIKELEAFSYSVSHDLRAPLRAISSFSRILVDEYRARLDDHGKDYLNRVVGASAHMADLIDDLLTLSRLTRTEVKQVPVDLTATARSLAEEIRSRDPGRRATFEIAEGLQATADPGLIRIALGNLLDNAWKFTSKGAETRIEVGSMMQDEERVFFIRDNGAGFEPQYSGKLFGAFQRLHHREEFEGTGIGLATVQRIIHRHGGRVWAQGLQGQGATFYFTL